VKITSESRGYGLGNWQESMPACSVLGFVLNATLHSDGGKHKPTQLLIVQETVDLFPQKLLMLKP
jgi:hypothetical protein